MNIIYKDDTESTNLDAKRLAQDGAPEWTVVSARRQSGGRGRLGRSFFSPEGGLYLSVILRPTMTGDTVTLLTTAAAAAMSRAIESVFKKDTKIKWVNDIYIDGRKVCGILTETAYCGAALDYAIVGVGVNLYRGDTAVPKELENIMGFVCDSPDCKGETLTNAFLAVFKEYYDSLTQKPHLTYYKQKQLIKNTPVTVLQNGNETALFAMEIDDNFHLRVCMGEKETTLSFGEVSVRL